MCSRDILHRAEGITLIESTQIRWFSRWSGEGGWSLVLEAKSLKTNSKAYQTWVHSDQMVLVIARWKAGPCERRPNLRATSSDDLRWELGNNSRKPRNLTKNRQSDSLQESSYSFLRGSDDSPLVSMKMMIFSENQPNWSQIHVTAILGTNETMLKTQFK